MKRYIFLSALLLLSLAGCGSEKNTSVSESREEASSAVTTEAVTSSVETALSETTAEMTTDTKKETTDETKTVKAATVQTTAAETEPETEPVTAPPMDLPDGQLVRILDYIPDAVIDLRYATTNNFTGTVIYDSSEAYLCFGTVKKLMNVQAQLKEKGYMILIWYAYRPIEAQWALWNVCPDPNFVADPNNGVTSHGRGNTMDISLVYDEDGSEVTMPSLFDEFNASADRDYNDVSAEAAANAQLLEEVMFSNGFTGYRGEWWDYSDTNRYELIMPQ